MVVAIQANSDVEKILPTVKRLSSVFEALVLGDNGELAVMAFDHRVTTLTDFTSEPAKIDAAFKKLTPGSYSSNLNEAAMKGINLLRDRPKERRRVLVLIAENRDKGSEIKVREVLSAGEFANVVVYTVNVSQLLASLTSKAQPNRPNPIPPEARQLPAGVVGTPTTDMQMEMGNWVPAFKDIFLAAKGVFLPDPLDVYTKFTGGREFAFKTQKSLEKDISQLGEELHSQYFLTYFPSTQEESGFHQIVVTVDRPNVKVRTRDGYYWAGKPE
jgi:VWFA-related protein